METGEVRLYLERLFLTIVRVHDAIIVLRIVPR
jgi:hypothetical protein